MNIKNTFYKIFFYSKLNCLQYTTKGYDTCESSISTVGFIGLGAMGSHMAKHLIKKFKEVVVYDVNESAVLNLAKEGAKVAHSVDDLHKSDCIISMLPANQHVYDVYQGSCGLISKVKPGTLLIDCSTVDPKVPQELAAEAEQKAVIFADAPVSGGVLAAQSGQLTFMVGGSDEAAQRSEQVLRTMGKNVIHCGSSGCGQTAKICNNMLLGISMIATSEAMNLGIRLGLDAAVMARVVNSSSGRCWSSDTYNPVPGVLPNVPSSNNYQGGFQCRLILKDLGIANSIAQRTGSSTPLGNQALDIYQKICEQGKADLDFSVVYQFIKELKSN